jgi:glycerol-3-phosphate dehydrogenase (NAD(P)+)
MKLGIVGAGAWGTGLAIALAQQQRQVVLHVRDAAQYAAMQQARVNARYLPDIALPASLNCTDQLALATRGQDAIVIATPLAGLRETLRALEPIMLHNQPVVWLCKGFEAHTAKLPHEVVREVLPFAPHAVLTGPSFAQEVARGLPVALTLGCADAALQARLQPLFHGGAVRVYTSDDLLGCELGGALKNVMAIATGVADGMGLGLNARAALMTRGLAEMTRLGVAMGAKPETFMGLTGMGDLILTCTGALSRNRAVGLALGEGQTLTQALEQLGHVAEGVGAAREAVTLAQRLRVEMPIAQAVQAVLVGGQNPRHILAHLLSRDATRE